MFTVLLMFLGIFSKEAISVLTECDDKNFYGPTGRIMSPNFPMNYANKLDCYNYISVTFWRTIVITFLAFSTEQCCDWVTITCESGKTFKSPRYSGFEFPSVLTISSCELVNVTFHTDGSVTSTGFSLTYNITSEAIIGGIITKPSNAFLRANQYNTLIFNCTTRTKHLPWWRVNNGSPKNYTLTNSSCGVITSAPYSYWFMAETLGPGSCNLIMIAPGSHIYLLAGSLVCTDSTFSSAGALVVPINLGLFVTKRMNLSSAETDVIRDEDLMISCDPAFNEQNAFVYTYSIPSGGPTQQLRISLTYWTLQGDVVSSSNTFNTSNVSSYVMVKATTSDIASYTCHVVFGCFSDTSNISGGYSIEISESTEPIKVLYWPTEENMTIIGLNNGQIRSTGLLFCHVPANPPATYQWIDESNGYITTGPAIAIIRGGQYTCKASNFIRGQYYQQLKSINVEVIEDDTHRLKILAIILGALLGVAVLIIIIILAILIRKCRHQKTNTTADVGHSKHVDEQELQQRTKSNRYETGSANPIGDVGGDYENLNDSRQTLTTIPTIYQELVNRK